MLLDIGKHPGHAYGVTATLNNHNYRGAKQKHLLRTAKQRSKNSYQHHHLHKHYGASYSPPLRPTSPPPIAPKTKLYLFSNCDVSIPKAQELRQALDRAENASLQLRDEVSTLRAKGELLRIERDSAASRVARLEEDRREKEASGKAEKEEMVS